MSRYKNEMSSYKAKPEYRQALQELIKFEIQALVSSLLVRIFILAHF